jgi:hypothetical protein
MRKILVMIPAGEVYNYDCVRWYKHKELSQHIDHYHNIGDAFVYDSSLKLLNYDVLDVVKIVNPTPTDIDRYNAEFDYVFLRASNYIHPAMQWENAVAVLEKLKIPVVVFGIGAQAPTRGPLTLSDETKRVLRLIADHTASVGVRGAYTAEVLWNIGIKNVRIVGCPTAFRRNDPDLRIDLPPLSTVRRVGVTLRREVSAAYAQEIERYLCLHRELVRDLASRFDVELMAQGEVEEKNWQSVRLSRKLKHSLSLPHGQMRNGTSTRRCLHFTRPVCSIPMSLPTTSDWCGPRILCSATGCTEI